MIGSCSRKRSRVSRVVLHGLVVVSLLVPSVWLPAAAPPRAAAASPPLTPTTTVSLTVTPPPSPTLTPAPTLPPTPTSPATVTPTLTLPPPPTATPSPTLTPTPTVTPTPWPPDLPPGWALVLPDQGGTLASPDGRLAVHVPPGAVTEPVLLSYAPRPPLDLPPDHHLLLRFDLDAWQADQPDAPAAPFALPVTVTVGYDPAEVEGLLEAGLRLVTFDEALQAWTPLTSTIDTEARQVTAQVSHFSPFALEGEDEVFFLPRIEAGQVSLFSGDSSFSFDLATEGRPSGVGGLRPQGVPLSLKYSGGIPNGLRQPLSGPDTQSDTGWVGVGWTLDAGRFEEEQLTFNGLSTGVKMLSTGAPSTVERCSPKGCTPGPASPWCRCESGPLTHRRQQTSDVQFFRIESDAFSGETFDSLDQVDVWTKDGTHYLFGSQGYVPSGTCTLPSGAQVECGTGSRLYATRNSGERIYTDYKLDTVVDPHGNRLAIEYTVFPQPGSNHTQLKESYPRRILYTTNPAAGDQHAEYEVEFVVDKKAFDLKAEKKFAETGFFLQAVNVWFHYDAGDPAHWEAKKLLVRQVRFAYDAALIAARTAYELVSVTQYAPDQVQHLPATSFAYTPATIGWRINDSLGGTWHTVGRRFLATVDNGYGGALTFGYAGWTCYDYATSGEVEGEPFTCAGEGPDRLAWSQRQVVQSKSLSPGVGSAMTAGYSYAGADVKWTRDPPAGDYGCRGRMTGEEYETCFEQFIGFEQAAEEWTGGGGTLKRGETVFHDTEGRPTVDQAKGKVEETSVRDGSGVLQARTATTYAAYTEAGWPEGVQFVYAAQAVEETCGEQGEEDCQTKKTVYSYDLRWQNCGGSGTVQYGNLTRVEEYDGEAAPAPYRTTLTGYCPNDAAWVVDRPAFVNLYAGGINPDSPDVNRCRSSTWYIYSDDQDTPPPNWDQVAGSKGELRGVRRVLKEQSAWKMADARYRHDAYGNVTEETAYGEYGSEGAWAMHGDRTTITEYDPQHHTWPVRVTDPITVSHPITHVVETQYYEVNETDDSGSGLPGQMKLVRNINNQADTWSEYDAFGRLAYQWLPGDSAWQPAMAGRAYGYDDTARRLYTRQRDDPGGDAPTYLEGWQFYDGLGRPIQSQAEGATADQSVVTGQAYDALGRPEKESVPAFYPAAGGSYRPPDWDQAHSATAYDLLDRPTRVTHPDGTSVELAYGYVAGRGWRTQTWDENDHRTESYTDPFGRLAWLHEVESDDPAGVHVTEYVYDERDNLVAVYDAAAHDDAGQRLPTVPYTTTMSYDLLGRKTEMNDPDMGTWKYDYDALGNLARQTDARGQHVCFTYDALNRVTGKSYTYGDTCPTSPDVTYTYDEGVNGVGRRTSMADGSGTAAWTYDKRGRVTQESKTIAGAPGRTFATSYTYDAMDRVLTTAYPDGEVTTTTYDPRGLPRDLTTSLDANGSYVQSATYDALGRMEQRVLGSGARQVQYTYYPWTEANGQGRLRQIQTGTAADPGLVQDLRYTYDATGNVLTIQDLKVTGGTQTQSFAYDPLDRLLSAAAEGGSAGQGQYSHSYGYSATGNLTNRAGVTYTYPPAVQPHAVVSSGDGGSFGYDANGNMTGRKLNATAPTYTHAWDAENRLASVTANSRTTAFTYDGDGSLAGKDDGITITTYAGAGFEVAHVPAGRVAAGDTFADGSAGDWSPAGGTWLVESGAYSGQSSSGSWSLWTPTFHTGRIRARVQTQSWSGHALNAFLVFDFRDNDNYRYAGLMDDSDQWVIGEKRAGSLHTRASAAETINTGQWYNLELVVSGNTASLKAGGVKKVGYTFGDALPGGKMGLRVSNAHSHFDDVVVSCHAIDDFRDGNADGWTPGGGTWQVENPFYGDYSGQAADTQISLWNQSMLWGRLGATTIAQLDSTPQYNGFLVFDYTDADHYKYAGMDGTGGRWVIREVVGGTDTLLASRSETLAKGTAYSLELQVSGSQASLKVGGVVKVSYTFSGGIRGGRVGLRLSQAHTHFKEVYLGAAVSVTKYYAFNGQRVAMRKDNVLHFLLADHLGTTSAVLDAQGTLVDESRHLPYGAERWPLDGTFPTDYRFTGQRLDSYIKLYSMGARQYDPELGRWISPDSIIQDPANPQSFNRYSYVMNRPLVAIDPSGHDLVIVGGAGGNTDLAEWKKWVMAYKGWSEDTFTDVLKNWQAIVAEQGLSGGNELLAGYGVHIFTWGGNTVQEAAEKASSTSNETLLQALSDEMDGHRDITLLGWSKGGNLAMRYLQELPDHETFVKVKHAVLISPADTWLSTLAPKIALDSLNLPNSGVNVANICRPGDPVCHTRLPAAVNLDAGLQGHGPHGNIAKQALAALNVANDTNAWQEKNSWH